MTESLTYDNLHRVLSRTVNTAANLSGSLTLSESYAYDDNGNLLSKGNVGYYQYNVANKPNRLAGIWQNSNFSGTKHYTFSYDNNGNVTDDGKRSFTYTSFDKPSRITQGTNTTDFSYGPARELYKRVDVRAGQTTSTLMIDGIYEQVTLPSGVVEHKYSVGDAVVTKRSNGVNATNYVHKDHLGSTIAVTKADGNILQQFIYDPWGKQYTVYTDTISMMNFTSEATSKGYTGHEMVNDFDVIHMGGRTYNPVLGRFMQADPHIQFAGNLQSYNRYSYVMNIPMKYTDPSGYFLVGIFKKYWRQIAAIAISFYMGPWAAGYFNSAVVGGAVTGFVAGGVATGSLRGAVSGAIAGAVFGGISELASSMSHGNFVDMAVNEKWELLDTLHEYGGNFLTNTQIAGVIGSHAIAGGVIADLQGGKFGHGFWSAGFTKAAMGSYVSDDVSFGNAIKSAIVGGTASVISGSKFVNGAITGAFQYSLNWATKAHNYLIKQAYGKELSKIEIAAMEAGSKYTDRLANQDDENSYQHSMTSSKNPDVAKMGIRRDQWVTDQVVYGVSALDGSLRGNISGYFRIGMGIHAVMDQYSPAHTGTNQHWHMKDFYKHGPFPTSLEGTRTVVQPKYNFIVDKMKGVWRP